MDNTFTAIAGSNGLCTVTVAPGPPTTLTWVIAQFSISVSTFRSGATATIRRNGRFITASSQASNDTAYGPPAISMNSGDTITCDFTGLTQGDQAYLTLWYAEQPYGSTPNPDIVV